MSSEKQKLNVLLAASGTGGHLFPALSFAEEFQNLTSGQYAINFVGTGRPIEIELLAKYPYPRHEYQITGLSKLGLRGIVDFLRYLPRAISQVLAVLNSLKPVLIIGFGGYASVLPVLLGRLHGIPTLIFESEKKAGLANRFLSLIVHRSATAYPNVRGILRSNVEVGRVLRPALLDFHKQHSAALKKILIMGGSQGCRSIDLAMLELAPLLAERGLELWHQARPENVELLKDAYSKHAVAARVCSFIDKTEEAYQWADLAISRSGAGAVLELAVVGLPSILVPLPKAEEQFNNARFLEGEGKAIMVCEGSDFVARLRQALERYLDQAFFQTAQTKRVAGLMIDGARRLAELSLSILKGSN